MTQKTINSSPRRPLSLRQLLGIAHDGDPLWDQVRAMQLQASQQFLPLKMAMSIVYASCLALTLRDAYGVAALAAWCGLRSEEHTSELQPLMRTSYAVFC